MSLQNALVNLLVNARDTFDGSGQVTIETSNIRIDDEYVSEANEDIMPGSYAMLAVSDNGNGISSDIIDQNFDPFYTTKSTGKGSGLGLSMVHGFVKKSGGAIRVYSEVGSGTSFNPYFPATRKDTTEQKPVGVVTDPERPTGKGRILLVEDQPEALAVIEKTLKAAGYKVVTAENGDAAYQIFETEPHFDLVATGCAVCLFVGLRQRGHGAWQWVATQ